MEATSIDGLVAHCQSARFTGILRMRAHEGIGEVWFLSGVSDEMHFGTSTSDEALERMRKATEATYELVSRLPHPAGGFKKRFPAKGSIATATPVTLMRYCEQYALTCTLAVESGDVLVEAKYVLGDLVSVETTANDDGITAMLEATEGTYEFTLPRVELPAGTPVLPPASGLVESIPPPESLGFRALLENKPTSGRPASDEAELKRKTVEIARQQKTATATAKPTAEKREAATPKPAPAKTPPQPVVAKKAEPKPAAAPVAKERAAAPRPAKAVATPIPETKVEKVDAKPEPAPIPTPAPAPVVEEKREEPPPPVEAAKEEPKPAAAPVVETPEEAKPEEPDEPEPIPAGLPAKRPMTWLVVPLLLLLAISYLWWTHRF